MVSIVCSYATHLRCSQSKLSCDVISQSIYDKYDVNYSAIVGRFQLRPATKLLS